MSPLQSTSQKRFCNLENKGGGTFEFAYYSTEYLNDETRCDCQ